MQSKTQWRMNIDETEEISKTIEYLSELVTPSKVGLITSLETLRSQCFNNFVRRTSNIFWNKKNVQHINKVNSSIMSSNSVRKQELYLYRYTLRVSLNSQRSATSLSSSGTTSIVLQPINTCYKIKTCLGEKDIICWQDRILILSSLKLDKKNTYNTKYNHNPFPT